MNNRLLLLLLLSFVFIASCQEDDDGGGDNNMLLPIQVRMINETDQDLAEANFRFDWEGVAPGYQEYGPLDAGVTTEYKGFEAGGDCSLNFQGVIADTNEALSSLSLCLCICQLDEGFYNLRLTQDSSSTRINASLDQE